MTTIHDGAKNDMTYEQAIEYIHSVYWRGSKLGLERITELLSRMGNPQDSLRFVHVAGTNGKGSVCAMLCAVLQAQGYKTGMYTSPFLERFNERMQINGVPIADQKLCEVTEYVQRFAESMANLPTEFEIVCAIAFEFFKREQCDIVVLEVGLGGRLDATNVIKTPLAAVLTAIDYDHMQYLGDTLREIALEKCGIIKDGGVVVCYEQQPEARAVVETVCGEKNAKLYCCDFARLRLESASIVGQTFHYRQFRMLNIRLLGPHQIRNAALVVETVLALRDAGLTVADEAVYAGLVTAEWPGRFEVLLHDPLVVFDGAHNPHGVRAAAQAARAYINRPVVALIGVLEDKQYEAMLETVNAVAARYVATQPDNPRALSAQTLGHALEKYNKPVHIAPDVTDAAAYAYRIARENGMAVLALGSLFMAGDIRKFYREIEG